MLFFLPALALAADPARCVATWTGPKADCAVRGELTASANGTSRRAAEKAIHKELAVVTERAVAGARLQMPGVAVAEFAGCAARVEKEAFVDCFDAPELAEIRLCFVQLDDPTCWNGDVLNMEGVAWQMLAKGRKKMCEAVDERLVTQNYLDVATRRAVCAATCEMKTRVSCPAG
jgi:hypothetical protein